MFSTIFGGSAFEFISSTGKYSFALPGVYGFVLLTGVATVIMTFYLGVQVGLARKRLNVPLPQMYSATNELFNCHQRAHQNAMETYSQMLFLLLVGGLEMPIFCSIGGCVYILGRLSYAKGYCTGDPKQRVKGAYGYIGFLMMLIAVIKLSLKLLL